MGINADFEKRQKLGKMKCRQLSREEIPKTDKKLEPSGIFVKEDHPRVDIFAGMICDKFKLSHGMIKGLKRKCLEISNFILCARRISFFSSQ